jgi:hypothetical protein
MHVVAQNQQSLVKSTAIHSRAEHTLHGCQHETRRVPVILQSANNATLPIDTLQCFPV